MTMVAETNGASARIPRRYSLRTYKSVAKLLHWLTAALVLFMVGSGVLAKQLGSGAGDNLLGLHKLAGAAIFVIVLIRIAYRFTGLSSNLAPGARRPIIHWMLYGALILIPLVGWAGVSDYGTREIFAGYSLPAIWPEGTGYSGLLFELHAYLAFAMLALVALHIGVAIQDHIMRTRPDAHSMD